MYITQAQHQLAVNDMDLALVSTGGFKAIPHVVSNDFVNKALEDGVVEEFDTKNNLLIVRYKDGTKGIIDTETKHKRSPDGKLDAVIKIP